MPDFIKEGENINCNMIHLTSEKLNEKILIPRIPVNYYTNNGYEDNTIPRICFSENIDGALIAGGVSHLNDNNELYVYEPIHNYYKTISNYEIIKRNLVPDASYTKEIWIIESVKLKCIGKIGVGENSSYARVVREIKFNNLNPVIFGYEWIFK